MLPEASLNYERNQWKIPAVFIVVVKVKIPSRNQLANDVEDQYDFTKLLEYNFQLWSLHKKWKYSG